MTLIIGICGGSGAGKTTLLHRLKMVLDVYNPTIISMDNYYKPINEQHIDENGEVNFDLPTAMKSDEMLLDLKRLRNQQKVVLKEYQFNASSEKPKEIVLQPSKLIVVEGLFTLHFQEISSLLDYSIYVELDKEEQLKRRVARDVVSRGYSEEMIKYQWHNHVMPCYAQFLQPYKAGANFVFHNDHRANQDFENLVNDLKKELNFM